MKLKDITIRGIISRLSAQYVPTNILIFSFLLFVGCAKKDSVTISRIDVYGIEWGLTTRSDLNASEVINWKGRSFNTSQITNQSDLASIALRLKTLERLENFKDIDTRVVCILHFSNSQQDTLQIANTQIIKYKGVIFDKDLVLIDIINKVLYDL